jgi:hypothetical protein
MGRGKWIPRLVKNLDEDLYCELVRSLNRFYQGNKQAFVEFVTKELDRYGGRLFEGYSIGKNI